MRLLFVVFAVLAVAALPVQASETAKPLQCVVVTTSAPYRNYGYDHLVHLDNRCAVSARCVVKTDVNPEPSSVDLAVGQKTTLVTFRGSPASTFVADVVCRER